MNRNELEITLFEIVDKTSKIEGWSGQHLRDEIWKLLDSWWNEAIDHAADVATTRKGLPVDSVCARRIAQEILKLKNK